MPRYVRNSGAVNRAGVTIESGKGKAGGKGEVGGKGKVGVEYRLVVWLWLELVDEEELGPREGLGRDEHLLTLSKEASQT